MYSFTPLHNIDFVNFIPILHEALCCGPVGGKKTSIEIKNKSWPSINKIWTDKTFAKVFQI
jgi:hypothetical protein